MRYVGTILDKDSLASRELVESQTARYVAKISENENSYVSNIPYAQLVTLYNEDKRLCTSIGDINYELESCVISNTNGYFLFTGVLGSTYILINCDDTVEIGSMPSILEPEEEGTNGQVLTTDGNGNRSWKTVDSLPSQSGQNGKFLTTDGTTASWATIAASGDWSTLANKPFSTIGDGLKVVDDALTLGVEDDALIDSIIELNLINPMADENNNILTDENNNIISFEV